MTLLHNVKAQAALEFLMTYGWAILVVLVVISAMAYFGVLSPSNLLPEKCTFQASFACKDSEAGQNGVQIVLQNSAGKDIRVTSVTFSSDALNSLNGVCSTGAISAVVKNSQQAAFYATDPLNCAFKETGRAKNKYTANITYQFSDSVIPHVVSGEIVARAGSGAISESGGGFGGGSGDASLVGRWRFDVNENPTRDDSGNGNNGAVMNGAAWQAAGCKSGGCYSFDGVNQFINVSNSAVFDFATAFTLSAWIKPNSVSDGQQRAVIAKWISSSNSYILETFNTQAAVESRIGGVTKTVGYITVPLAAGSWAHLAATYDGSVLRLYANGAEIGNTPASGAVLTSTTNLLIGAAGTIGKYNGAIDEIAIYNRALSPQEISQLAS